MSGGTGVAPAADRRGRALLTNALGVAVAVLCLFWVFHDIDVAAAARSLRGLRWIFVPLVVLLDTASYACQGLRWSLLLGPDRPLGAARATQAVYAGLFTNEVLPGRLGEGVRAVLARRWTGASYAGVVSSMLLERFCDAVWLLLAFGITAILVPLPRELLVAGDVLGVVVLVAAAVFLLVVLRKPREKAEEGSIGRGPVRAARRLASELGRLGSRRAFWAAFLVSALIPALQGAALWTLARGYGFGLGLWSGLAVYLILHLGTALPNAPGNIGSWQLFCVLGLALFGVAKAPAAGFSVASFAILTFPLWALGAVALARSGTTLASIRKEVAAAVRRRPAPAAPAGG